MSDPTNAAARRCTLCGNFHCPGTPQPDPAPSGLTAAQEARAEALHGAVRLLADLNLRWPDEAVKLDSWVADEQLVDAAMRVVEPLTLRMAALIEHGPDETPQIREWARALDKALKTITDVSAERDDLLQKHAVLVQNVHELIVERDQAQADALEDQRVRLLLEYQRDAVLAYLDECDRGSRTGMTEQIRAIYAERGDEPHVAKVQRMASRGDFEHGDEGRGGDG